MRATYGWARWMRWIAWALLGVATFGLWQAANRAPVCTPPRYYYVRDTLVVRDTVHVLIPERRVHARLPARKGHNRYTADTVLATGESVRIAFVEDSLLFHVDVVVPPRDTAVPRVLTVVPPTQPVPAPQERGTDLPLLVGALAVGVVIGVLLR